MLITLHTCVSANDTIACFHAAHTCLDRWILLYLHDCSACTICVHIYTLSFMLCLYHVQTLRSMLCVLYDCVIDHLAYTGKEAVRDA
jgi:hypothetical protein